MKHNVTKAAACDLLHRKWRNLIRAIAVIALLGASLSFLIYVEDAEAAGSRTLLDVYGVSRNEVVSWLTSHENDGYYLGTPYRPYDWRSPNGDINSWGANSDGSSAGMNCTGFIWHALCAAHGWRDSIAYRLPAMSGWFDAIQNHNLKTYVFSSKREMLSSGVLEKGDIIWMWENGDATAASDHHHIGIFWGDRSDQDLMWHSEGNEENGWSGINACSDIHGKASSVSYQVVKLGGPLYGAISLQKRSSIPAITDSNGCYSLEGAVYGLFQSKDDAASHDASKAQQTFSTDATGSFSTAMDIPVGSYYIAECSAPRGYALDTEVYGIEVLGCRTAAVNAGGNGVADAPITNPIDLWSLKHDAQTADGGPQGNATLEGTLFEIAYYDGYYSLGTLPSHPTRTWVFATDDAGQAVARDGLWNSGDELYHLADGRITVPLGTVTIRELQPPRGYTQGSGPRDNGGEGDARALIQITADEGSVYGASPAEVYTYAAPSFDNDVIRGGVAIGKRDRQNGEFSPQGAATLEGAAFTIVSESALPVIVDGQPYKNGQAIMTIETELDADGRYCARTPSDCLPYGDYAVYETSTSEGYLLDEASKSWCGRFSITGDGQVCDLTQPGSAAENQVIRGDFSFTKVDGTSGRHLAGVPFEVTSRSTGESHVIVTDENGMASTEAAWNALWFDGSTELPCTPDGSLGSLPYDIYDVKELRDPANTGYTLASFTVRITRPGTVIDLGTVDDNAGPLVDTSLGDANRVKLAPAGSVALITDQVEYANLIAGEQYAVQGSLHLITPEGEDGGIVAQSSAEFSPRLPDGSIDVRFDVDTSDLAGQRLVAFEQLSDASGTVLAMHEDPEYEGQTVRVPSLHTSLADAADGDKLIGEQADTTLIDTVEFKGLTPYESYTLVGTLHVRNPDGSDGGIVQDSRGRQAIAYQTFASQESEGSVDVAFSFDSTGYGGYTLVCFEELVKNNAVYAAHADISDDGQSVFVEGTPMPTPVALAEPEPEPEPEPAPEPQAPSKLPATGDGLPITGLVATACISLTAACAAGYAHWRRQRAIDEALYLRAELGGGRIGTQPGLEGGLDFGISGITGDYGDIQDRLGGRFGHARTRGGLIRRRRRTPTCVLQARARRRSRHGPFSGRRG